MSRINRKAGFGFTLIEIMIVITILSIIVAIAYPSYTTQVRKTRRADAQQAILEAANSLERFFTNNNAYTTSLAALNVDATSQEGHYAITVATANNNREFTITATAQGDQTNDPCGNFTLTSTGVRDVTGTEDRDVCW